MAAALKPSSDLQFAQRKRIRALTILALLACVAIPFFQSSWTEAGELHEGIETAGLVAICIAVLGRAWCTLYIGGRKSTALTVTGPYSISRNPLYVFSLIGVMGAGWQTGSLSVGFIMAVLSYLVFFWIIGKEEEALHAKFGWEYEAYRHKVPKLWPRFSAWQDADSLIVNPRLVWRTVRDGAVFLLFIPAFEAIDWLQASGWIKPFLHLP